MRILFKKKGIISIKNYFRAKNWCDEKQLAWSSVFSMETAYNRLHDKNA